jgi:hypothetical protein
LEDIMLWKNECGHPLEDYLFSITGPINSYDVCYYRHSLGDKNEFCLRYGNEDHEYLSSWDCSCIERRISHLNKFGETPTDKMELIMFNSMKNKIQEKGYWDIAWDLTPEVTELQRVVRYDDAPEDTGKDNWRLERLN